MIKPLISIIIPIYNVSSYLRECLESVERQTLKNIEVILINDGSTDGSDKIAEEFVKKNKNFNLFNRENGGLSAARNTGIEHSNGEYVYFLDSDDFIAENALEKLYYKAKNQNLDQIRFSAYTFQDGTNDYCWNRNTNCGYKYLGDYKDVMSGKDFYYSIIKNNDYFPSCCLIFTKREVIEKNNLRFIEGLLHEDNLFNFELTINCNRVSLINEPLYYRRYRADSIMTSGRWGERIKSLYLSAFEADKFIDSNQEIFNDIGKWQITFFIYMMCYYWCEMAPVEQKNEDFRSCFLKIKPLIKKYKINKFSINLFYFNSDLFGIYKKIFLK